MDTVINAWMIEHCGLDIEHGDSIGLCVESQCRYVESAAYPETLDIGLRAARVGSSSMTWELAMVRADDTPIALGRFVHVFVDAQTRRPTPIPDRARDAMRGILAPGAAG
ncbi:MAG: acyl-CoA thioesterase [Micrococcales bacterium]|nr:acyl-CoA thioesterase [Micrococcales bacterium]